MGGSEVHPDTINEMVSAARELSNIRQALDQAAIVAITDQTGKITHVNEKFCQISQYSREELIGQNHRIINSGHHPKEFFENMWKTISSGKYWEGEVCNRAKDGTLYWVNTTIAPFLTEAGKPYQYVSIRYEITQRKRAEEELQLMVERLKASNRELQDFASVAAHDLQEPLRKIQTFGDRLNTKFASEISEDARDYLNRMLVSAGRMRKLIDDLLTFSRVTSKGNPFQATDLNEVLKDVLSDLEVTIEQRNGKVEVCPLPTIEADASQMRQLFQNLIANGLKFQRPGVAPIIKISANILGNVVHFEVEDNGIGFEEKYLDRIFTIFQRLHGRHEYEGTGVGLAVCRKIVERHGGTITAKSLLGQGATFLVTMPIKQVKLGVIMFNPNDKRENVTILIADDDADDRLMISDALRESRLANDLHFVENGVDLIDYLRNRGKFADTVKCPRPGLILLDLNMPKMDGREALKEIKSDPDLKRIPVVVLTTSKAEEDIYRTYNLGVNSFVTKPVTFESLVTIVREIGRYWFEIVELPSGAKK